MSPFLGEDRISELRREARARLASACAEWPGPMFDTLLESIASITYKYERLVGDFSFEPSGPGASAV